MTKAPDNDFDGRFREILSDPLNLLIVRHPEAGFVQDGLVCLHNGHWVPLHGEGVYYGDFSKILIYNRGVHEPLEEFAFQTVLRHLPKAPRMLELGAYWAHYSMWLHQAHSDATTWMVEPEAANIEAGRLNFARNGYAGTFIQAFVGQGQFGVDRFLSEHGVESLDILHCDIQGFEVEMLEDARRALAERRLGHVFISTHSQSLHAQVEDSLARAGYRVELTSDFDTHSTSFDGFILASDPRRPRLFPATRPLGRTEIATARPEALLASLAPFQAQ